MNKKILIIASSITVILIISLLLITRVNTDKIFNGYKDNLEDKLKIVDNIVNKYNISKSGEVEVVANYKGAHGENYPAKFNYNYLLDDKLYFEDNEYTSYDLNHNLLNIIDTLKNLNKLDLNKYEKIKKKHNKVTITYDEKYINELLNTNYESISVDVNLSGLIKNIKDIQIRIDDILITINNKDIIIKCKNNLINLTLDKSATYLNVNNKLKMNIFLNNNYTFSIVLNNKVYSLELLNDGFNLKFNTSASIYNSLNISVKYKDVKVDKKNEALNYNDNPIIRYLRECDLSL